VIVLIVEIDNLELDFIDPKRNAPIPADREAPSAFSVARQLVSAPTGDTLQLLDSFHLLEERDHVSDFLYKLRWKPSGIIFFDESSQPSMSDIADFHTEG
jgi:hypothetical protein